MAHTSISSPAYDHHKRAPSKHNSFDAIMGIDSVESLHTRISQMTVKPQPEPTAGSDQDQGSATESVGSLSDSDVHGGDNAPQIQNNQVQPPSAQMEQSVNTLQQGNVGMLDLNLKGAPSGGDVPGSGLISPDGSSTSSLSQLAESNLNFFTQSATAAAHIPPDVVGSNTAAQQVGDGVSDSGSGLGGEKAGSNSSLPSILADLTPQNFSMEKPVSKQKQKSSKADFMSGKSKLGEQGSADDPFSMLDPLWTVKKEQSGGGS